MRDLAARVLAAHDDATVLTIDFFDTLVTRSVAQPTHVFAEMERRLVQQRGGAWRGWARRRVEAEHAARRAARAEDAHRDVTLAEIHAELGRLPGLSFAAREELMAMERAVEVEHARPVPFGVAMCRLARDRGVRVVVVSDNYMPSEHLVQMAHACGLDWLTREDVFVSCEHGGQKMNGRLWKDVLTSLGVKPSRILHVGDDELSDGEHPRGLGIATFVRGFMRMSHRVMENTTPGVLPLSRIEACLRDEMDESGANVARWIGGGAVALVVAAQVADAAKAAHESGAVGVHFAARDGWMAHQVWNRVRDAGWDIPVATYTAFSRSVVWRATLSECTPETLDRFVGDDEVVTLRRMERRLGCALVAEAEPDAPMDAGTARAVMVANGRNIAAGVEELTSRFRGYLAGQGVLDAGHHVVVDLGWKGATVADLAQFVGTVTGGAATMEGRFTGLYWDASSHRHRLAMHGYAVDEFRGLHPNLRLLGMLRLWESLVTAPHGSVVGFGNEASGYAPVFADNTREKIAWDEIVGKVAESAMDAAFQILTGTHPSGVGLDDVTPDAVWAAMMQLGHTPNLGEVDALAEIAQVTSLDHEGKGSRLVAVPPQVTGVIAPDDMVATYEQLIKWHWLQGSLASWERFESQRPLVEEIRRTWPAMNRVWVDSE